MRKENNMKFKEGVDPNLRYMVLVMYTVVFGTAGLLLFIGLLGLFSFNIKIDDFEANYVGWWGRAHAAA